MMMMMMMNWSLVRGLQFSLVRAVWPLPVFSLCSTVLGQVQVVLRPFLSCGFSIKCIHSFQRNTCSELEFSSVQFSLVHSTPGLKLYIFRIHFPQHIFLHHDWLHGPIQCRFFRAHPLLFLVLSIICYFLLFGSVWYMKRPYDNFWANVNDKNHHIALPYPTHQCVGSTHLRWWRGTVVERRSLTGELTLSCAQPAADGWPLMWVNRPLQVSQLRQLSLSSFLGR